MSRAGFTPDALRFASENGIGALDLLSPADLRVWLDRHAPQAARDTSVELILRSAMRQIAKLVAESPGELVKLEWRELEKVLREVFEGIGFDTRLTRSGRDGGFDLELKADIDGDRRTYLVEVKHWMDQKPGPGHLDKLVQVTASRKANAGVLLSTSGFTTTLYDSFARISAPIRLGDGAKIVSLCRTYYRMDSPLWLEDWNLEETLFDGMLNKTA